MCRSLYCSGASLTARVQGSQPLDTQAGAPKGTLTWPQSAPVFSQSGQRRLTGCAWSLIVDTPSFISNTIVTPLIPSLSTLSLAGNQARNTYILPLPKGLLSVCVGALARSGSTSFQTILPVILSPLFQTYTPTVFERINVNLQMKGKPVDLQIWDTAGGCRG